MNIKQIDQMYAQDQANIRGMQEQREYSDIAGLSSQYNAGNQMFQQGLGGLGQTAMAGLSTYGKYLDSQKGIEQDNTSKNGTGVGNASQIFQSGKSLFDNLGSYKPQGVNNTGTDNITNYGFIPQNMGTFIQGQTYSPNQFYNPQNNN